MLNTIKENALIEHLAKGLPRSPQQLNRLHESDAELVMLSDGTCLACTTDSIAEEIRTGLYADPWLAGWMGVMASLSDLAAVGATPIGLLVAETLPPDATQDFMTGLTSGIADACRYAGTGVLGGDTNVGPDMIITGCALGIVPGGKPLQRVGCNAGDLLFTSGPLGRGNAFAFSVLSGKKPLSFRPEARLKEGNLLRGFASACMDTSDGVIATLDQLMRLNDVGFRLDRGWESALDRDSDDYFKRAKLPPQLLIAGHHGEFELIFTVPKELVKNLQTAAGRIGWRPVPIGSVVKRPLLTCFLEGREVTVDGAKIRNATESATRDLQLHLKTLLSAFRPLHSDPPLTKS